MGQGRDDAGDGWSNDGFREFVRTRYGGLLRVAYLLTGSEQEAEDLVQGAPLRVMRRWHRVDDPVPYVRPPDAGPTGSTAGPRHLRRMLAAFAAVLAVSFTAWAPVGGSDGPPERIDGWRLWSMAIVDGPLPGGLVAQTEFVAELTRLLSDQVRAGTNDRR